jgi:sugar phosphate isomerase/epimerase
MRVNGRHLGYCTNVHPGVTLAEVRQVLAGPVAEVKARACPDEPMGIGLWLSGHAAEELDDADETSALRKLLDELGLYVFSLNGFPHGDFHGMLVKQRVYRPDWLEDSRAVYTERLARALASLSPEGVATISTVPGAFVERATDEEAADAIAARLRRTARYLDRLRKSTGRTIVLALEPEPACMLESSADTIAFFEQRLFKGQDEAVARRHLGVCLDACHLAVGFEDPAAAVRALRAAGITIAKLQLSSGLRLERGGPEAWAALRPFQDDSYLHQVTERTGGTVRRFLDLDGAEHATGEVRVHMHVPIFLAELGGISTTQPELSALMAAIDESGCGHLEVETYTWSSLPARTGMSISEGIARELSWARAQL